MKKAIITKNIRKQDKVDVGVALDGHPVGTAVGDSDGEQPGLSPAHLPRLQRCRRGERHHDAATDHRRL